MLAEKTENFINGLCERTENKKTEWKPLRMCERWQQFAVQLDGLEKELEGFWVDVDSSYYFEKADGYIFFLETHYGSRKLFSPAMDKYILAVKIDAMASFECLCSSENGEWKLLLERLQHSILQQYSYAMPDRLYDFMEKVLED